ncbi:MAG: NifB/NifX family molybdenum-iron cluster-binding protein [Christensenellales bacterium]
MLIAIATDNESVSPHFGRCQGYTLVRIEGGKVIKRELAANPGHAPGAIPEFLHKKGAEKVVCGGIGARAAELFCRYGIEVLAGIDCSVDTAVNKLASGALKGAESLCSPGAGRGFGVEKTVCDHPHD